MFCCCIHFYDVLCIYIHIFFLNYCWDVKKEAADKRAATELDEHYLLTELNFKALHIS